MDAVGEIDDQTSIGDLDLLEVEIEGPELPDPGENVEVIEDLAPLEEDVEDAAAGPVDIAFDELKGHGVGAVRDRQMVAEDAVADVAVDGGRGPRAGNRSVLEGHESAGDGADAIGRTVGRGVPTLVPGGPSEGQDVG